MSELAELTNRVTKLEHEMADVRNLASGASSEASDIHVRLRAHTKSLEALRQTQIEQGNEMRQGFARLEGKMDHGFSLVAVGMAQINAQLAIAIGESGEAEES